MCAINTWTSTLRPSFLFSEVNKTHLEIVFKQSYLSFFILGRFNTQLLSYVSCFRGQTQCKHRTYMYTLHLAIWLYIDRNGNFLKLYCLSVTNFTCRLSLNIIMGNTSSYRENPSITEKFTHPSYQAMQNFEIELDLLF